MRGIPEAGSDRMANNNTPARPNDFLDRMQFEADPVADAAVAAVLDPWSEAHAGTSHAELLAANARQWELLGAVNRVFDDWKDNASIARWTPRPAR
jgi:hypothetical protein